MGVSGVSSPVDPHPIVRGYGPVDVPMPTSHRLVAALLLIVVTLAGAAQCDPTGPPDHAPAEAR